MSNPRIAPKCEFTRQDCDPSCECDSCKEYRREIKAPKGNKILFCRAFMYWNGTAWIGDKEYTHAESIEEARLIFWRSEDSREMRAIRIVDVAPVIGYFVTDTKGQELAV